MISQANSFRIPLKDNSVHACISSFPYFGLRSYGIPPIVIGGRADCRHVWGELLPKTNNRNTRPSGDHPRDCDCHHCRAEFRPTDSGQICTLCGAFFGSFGLEPTIAQHVQNAVLVCREIKRVLRPDGIFFLNYGDSYATSRNGRSAADGKLAGKDDRTFRDKPFTVDELPAKNLCLVPERIVIALQDDGWIVRSIAPWVKKNSMPESVKDRPGTAHEYIFMLTKGPRYYFDMEAVRRGYSRLWDENNGGTLGKDGGSGWYDKSGQVVSGGRRNGKGKAALPNPSGRALRTSDFFFDSLDAYIHHLTDIQDNGGMMLNEAGLPAAFVVNPRGYAGAHYATYPLELVSPMIKASTSERGCCPKCGNQWIRIKEPTPEYAKSLGNDWADDLKDMAEGRGHFILPDGTRSGQRRTKRNGSSLTADYVTTGWRPSCDCPGNDEVIPAIILDPFCGSGATLAAAHELGRRGIGLDLNPVYLAENALPRAEKKMSQKALGQLPMFKEAA